MKVAAFISVLLFFSSCANNKLTIEEIEAMVNDHPFLKEISVAITDQYLPDYRDDLLGQKKNGYMLFRGYTTAYYYKMHGFKVLRVENLIVNQDNNSAECQAILAPDTITEAQKELQRQSPSTSKPDVSPDGEPFTIKLKRFEDKGWTIVDFYHSTNCYFKINGWRDGEFIYNITPDCYKDGEVEIQTYPLAKPYSYSITN